MKHLWLMDGTQVRSILDVPSEARILVAGKVPKYFGIKFEDENIKEQLLRIPVVKDESIQSQETVGQLQTHTMPDVTHPIEEEEPTSISKPVRKNKVTFGLHSLHSEESKEKFKNMTAENTVDDDKKMLEFNETAEFGELDRTEEDPENTNEEEEQNLNSKRKLTRREKDQLVEETLLAKSILKRRQWMDRYQVSENVLFNLFSEFSAMIVIAKHQTKKTSKSGVKTDTNSLILDSKMKNLFAVEDTTRMSKYNYQAMS